MADRVPLEQLTLVRCSEEQIRQTLENHWPKWGRPRGFSLEQYLARGARLRSGQPFSKDGAHATWGLVDRRDPSVLLSHCETFRRGALILAPGAAEPRDATTYTVAAVFCPEARRGRGYARHMLRVLHYVLGVPGGLPPWPAAWGAPPAPGVRLGDAEFSVLYSGIGDAFYPSCRVGDGPGSTPGWVEQRQDTRTWRVRPGASASDGRWEWLGRAGTVALEAELARRVRADLPRRGDARRTRVAVLPTSAVAYQLFRFAEMWPDHPSPRFGCVMPPPAGGGGDADARRPFFIYSAVAKGPDAPQTLEIMHVQHPVPWDAVRAAAMHHGADSVKLWSDFAGWDAEEGGVTVEQNEDCPSLAAYGLGDVDWQFNDK